MRLPLASILILSSTLLLAGCGGGGGGGGGSDAGQAAATYVTQMGGSEAPGLRFPKMGLLPDGSAIVVGTHSDAGIWGAGEARERVHAPGNGSGTAASITKLDPAGQVVWTRILDGADDDSIVSVSTFPNGDFAVGGYVTGTLILGFGEPGETVLGSQSGAIFVARYSAAGHVQWAEQLAGTLGHGRPLVAADPIEDTLYVGVPFEQQVTFGQGQISETTLTPLNNVDWALVAYADNGKYLWSRQGFSVGDTLLTALDVTPGGDVVGVGAFGTSLGLSLIDPDEPRLLTGNALFHGFAVRFDSLRGDTVWMKRLGAGQLVIPGDVTVTPDGDIVAAGYFGGSAAFGLGDADPVTLNGPTALDGFLVRLNALGELEWARRFDRMIGEAPIMVRADATGGIVLGANISGTSVFAPGEPEEAVVTSGAVDFVIVRYDALGRLTGLVRHGAGGDEALTGMAIRDDGSILVVGFFEDTARIGGGTPADVTLGLPAATFVARLRANGAL